MNSYERDDPTHPHDSQSAADSANSAQQRHTSQFKSSSPGRGRAVMEPLPTSLGPSVVVVAVAAVVASLAYILVTRLRGRSSAGAGNRVTVSEEERRERRRRALRRFEAGPSSSGGDGNSGINSSREAGGNASTASASAAAGAGVDAGERREDVAIAVSATDRFMESPLRSRGRRTRTADATAEPHVRSAPSSRAARESSSSSAPSVSLPSHPPSATEPARQRSGPLSLPSESKDHQRDGSQRSQSPLADATETATNSTGANVATTAAPEHVAAKPKGSNNVVRIKCSVNAARTGKLPLKRPAAKKAEPLAAAAANAAGVGAANAEIVDANREEREDDDGGSAVEADGVVKATDSRVDEAAVTAAASAEGQTEATTKRRGGRRKALPPPAQLLCEVLSMATDLSVSPEAGDGPWGGEGWVNAGKRKRSRVGSSALTGQQQQRRAEIRLPLVRYSPRDGNSSDDGRSADDRRSLEADSANDDDHDALRQRRKADWSNLEHALRSILLPTGDDPFRPHLLGTIKGGGGGDACAIRTAATWHSNAVGSAARDGIDCLLLSFGASYANSSTASGSSSGANTAPMKRGADSSVGSIDREGLGLCLSVLAKYVAGRVASSVAREVSRSGPAAAAVYDDSSDDDDMLDDSLFCDGYGAEAVPQQHLASHHANAAASGGSSSSGSGTINELLDLCGGTDASRIIPARFLADVLSHHPPAATATSATAGGRPPPLALSVLRRALGRLPCPDGVRHSGAQDATTAATGDEIHRRLSAVSHLLRSSADVATALAAELKREIEDDSEPLRTATSIRGRDVERSSILRRLLCLGGYTVPDAGFEIAPLPNRASILLLPRFYVALKSTPAFPLGVFGDPALRKVVDEARLVMKDARTVSGAVLERCMKRGGRDEVFGWLGCLVRSNEAQATLLKEQLLTVDAHAHSSSRPFLLGTAVAVLNLCCQNLVEKCDAKGHRAFDTRYLINGGGGLLVLPPEERRLIHSSTATDDSGDSSTISSPLIRKFDGATEFFFLTAALLRIGLFPALRVREEFHQRHEAVLKRLEKAAASEGRQQASSLTEQRLFPEQDCRSAATLLGWTAFLDDHELMIKIVEFSLLQLRWLVAVTDDKETAKPSFALIPEWMAKLPAQWVAHVAFRAPSYITPHQGEVAVQYATKLLECGLSLSPAVQTELIRIAGAFIKAGVNRARRRHAARHRRRGFKHSTVEDDESDVVDDRDLDIYSSFDAKDLGVTVFTNKFVSTRLCPTLINTFGAMDAVEAMDMDREHHFDKFGVKSEVADLLLWLWSQPSGECRKSIVRLDERVLAEFVCSVRAAIGLVLGDAIQRLHDIRGTLKQRTEGLPLSVNVKRTLQFHSKHLAFGLAESRRFLLLLSDLSEEPKIASIMGGGFGESSVASDMATMVVSFLDKFIAEDGGTHPELDFRKSPLPTSKLLARLKSGMMAASEKEVAISDLIHARMFLSIEYGFDVSVMAHLLLGLAARWHFAAKRSGCGDESSAFLEAVASNEDCTIQHFRNLFVRLIAIHEEASAEKVSENVGLVFETDGHVDPSLWRERYETQDCGLDSCRSRKYRAHQDQMTHSRLDHIVSQEEITAFLNDLEVAKAKVTAVATRTEPMGENETKKIERQVLNAGHDLGVDEYAECLGDWIVSSDSFLSRASSSETTFAHFYDSIARKNVSPGLGKSLIKEARKCYRNLPRPHPNASIFVCYSEERMDLCRAVIIGAVDTPYSMGVFEFDVFYPALYPQCPPLVNFMTTGNKSVRFSPNLYDDGKVCISLLGTTNAGDESQRWNPNHSSLAQVLLSIQTQILGAAEPYFTEGGGHETMRGTGAGVEGSAKYNNTLRYATLRYAIIEQLKSPPTGFEEVTRRHFAMCRKRLLVQARLWTMEARGTMIYDRFRRAYEELLMLLSANDKLSLFQGHETSADSEEVQHQMPGSLPPLAGDMSALQRLDSGLYQHISDSLLDYVFDEEDMEVSSDPEEEDFYS